jgi:hypothetical protein
VCDIDVTARRRDDARHGASMNPGLIPEQERRPTRPRIGIAAEARYLDQR